MSVERFREVEVSSIARPEVPPGPRADRVVTEEPLEIRVEGEPLAVIMRTPGDDIELTAGFLLAEEIISSADDLGLIAHCRTGDGIDGANVVNVRLAETNRDGIASRLSLRKAERATVTSSSCGVCGKRTIESLSQTAKPFTRTSPISARVISSLPARLRRAQEVFDLTGGIHAAGISSASGEILVVREDVGRHNAVDKCVGHLVLRDALPTDGAILVVSGRASFEIVQKALVARIPNVVSVSAPSSLAIDLALASRMSLFGFVRGEGFNVYAGALDERE